MAIQWTPRYEFINKLSKRSFMVLATLAFWVTVVSMYSAFIMLVYPSETGADLLDLLIVCALTVYAPVWALWMWNTKNSSS